MSIFISYRRDEEHVTGRICDRLKNQGLKVFLDVDNIPPGVNFRNYLHEQVQKATVVLVVIGPGWVSPRLNMPNDWVRIEIEAALQLGKPIIPVLVRGASVPDPRELPAAIAPLTDLQAARVGSQRDFHHHVSELILAVDRLEAARERREQEQAFDDGPTRVRTVEPEYEAVEHGQVELDEMTTRVAGPPASASSSDWEDDVATTFVVGPKVGPASDISALIAEELEHDEAEQERAARVARPLVTPKLVSLAPPSKPSPPVQLRSFIPIALLSVVLVPGGMFAISQLKQEPPVAAPKTEPLPPAAAGSPAPTPAPPEVLPEVLMSVEDAADAAPDAPGNLVINSIPWAYVWIDGVDTGRTTPMMGYPLPPGVHEVQLRTAMGQIYTQRVLISPGKRSRVTRYF